MKPTTRAALVLGLILALAPASAWAVDGTITGLSFNPATGTANQDVTITVQGTEKCKKLNINFGDNSPVVTLDNPDFENNNTDDNSTTHAYSSDGSYTVTATAVEQCNGSAQSTFTVGAGGGTMGGIKPGLAEKFCAILDNCPKMQIGPAAGVAMKFLPKIESIFPFSVIEPGGAVIIGGKGFGSTPGELHLFLKTDNRDVKLKINEWGDGGIGAKIPSATLGVVDQQGEFYVKTAGGMESNRYGPVSFTAKRGIRVLPRSRVEVGFFGCGTAADCDACLGWRDPDDGDCFSGASDQGTVSGYHWQSCGLVGNDVDTDTYNLKSPLKNGWVLHDAIIYNFVDPGEGNATASVTSSQIKVNWSISPCDGIMYYATVIVRGPLGTEF